MSTIVLVASVVISPDKSLVGDHVAYCWEEEDRECAADSAGQIEDDINF